MKNSILLLVILLICSCSTLSPSTDRPDEVFNLDESYDPGTYVAVPEERIRELQTKTQNGDVAAARKLAVTMNLECTTR